MTSLREWSFTQIVLASGAWFVMTIVIAACWLFVTFWLQARSSGSGGIGAVSFGVNTLFLAIPVLPPILLAIAWLIVRRR